TRGGGDERSAGPTPSSTTSSSSSGQRLLECGTGTDGSTIPVAALRGPCRYTGTQLSAGLTYTSTRTPFENATVDRGTGVGDPVVGGACKNHNASAADLQASADPITKFVGPSYIGVAVAGLRSGGLVRIVVRAPDGQTRTGDGVADKSG